jgi:hypothetical protein
VCAAFQSSGVRLANRSAVNSADIRVLQELARQLPECDRAAKLRALLARVIDVDVQGDTQALTTAADALATSAAAALADDPWAAFEVAARHLRSRTHARAMPAGT